MVFGIKWGSSNFGNNKLFNIMVIDHDLTTNEKNLPKPSGNVEIIMKPHVYFIL
jgi:hypothetical protein